MTAEEICRLLATGWVDSHDIPEMLDDDVRLNVADRAAAVGLRLFYSPATDSYGFVLGGGLPETSSHRMAVRLDRSHRALIAVCWMHLRWLPAERRRVGGTIQKLGDEEPSMTVDELALQFKGNLQKARIEHMMLPHLKRLGYLDQREGKLYAGPMLDGLDEQRATEMARDYMLRYKRMAHLRQRAEQISQIRRSAEKAQGC